VAAGWMQATAGDGLWTVATGARKKLKRERRGRVAIIMERDVEEGNAGGGEAAGAGGLVESTGTQTVGVQVAVLLQLYFFLQRSG
jgi:hypothetical protein